MTYIIWSPQGVTPPSVVFNRRFLAEKESRRLSKLHPNQVFHVCKVKSATVNGSSAYFGHWRPRKKPDAIPISMWKKEFGRLEAGGLAAIRDPNCDPFRESVTVTLPPQPKQPDMDIRGFLNPSSEPVLNAPLQDGYAMTFFRSPKVVRDSGM